VRVLVRTRKSGCSTKSLAREGEVPFLRKAEILAPARRLGTARTLGVARLHRTLARRLLARTRKIAHQKSRKIISQITLIRNVAFDLLRIEALGQLGTRTRLSQSFDDIQTDRLDEDRALPAAKLPGRLLRVTLLSRLQAGAVLQISKPLSDPSA
jgi:hypothetical protein